MGDPKHVKKLVDRYIQNQATDQELSVFFSLLKQGRLHKVVDQYLDEEITQASTRSRFYKILNTCTRLELKIAASVSVLVMIGLVVYSTFPFQIAWFSSAHYVQIRTGDREIKSIKLVDGTLVQLNRNSTLQYPNEWTGAQRDVKLLQGEAFFEVKSDSLRRFVVRTPGGLAVEVLGTAFNVVQRPERTSVFLQKGKILLRQQQQTWEMTPGEWAEFETRRKTIRIQAADDDLWLAWLNDLFVFDDVPLDEIARIMEDYYAVRIDITNPSLARQRFTGKVPRQNIHLVMNVLAKTMNVKVLWKNGKFTMQPHE